MEISTTFRITDFKTKEEFEEEVDGTGQEAAKHIRSLYPRFSKIVLMGFQVDGRYIPPNFRTQNWIRHDRR